MRVLQETHKSESMESIDRFGFASIAPKRMLTKLNGLSIEICVGRTCANLSYSKIKLFVKISAKIIELFNARSLRMKFQFIWRRVSMYYDNLSIVSALCDYKLFNGFACGLQQFFAVYLSSLHACINDNS